jgi:hypothetical protein
MLTKEACGNVLGDGILKGRARYCITVTVTALCCVSCFHINGRSFLFFATAILTLKSGGKKAESINSGSRVRLNLAFSFPRFGEV